MNELKKRLGEILATTKPNTKARKEALAKLRWMIKAPNGYVGMNGVSVFITADRAAACIFDGRDNEDIKLPFFRALTFEKNLTVELL